METWQCLVWHPNSKCMDKWNEETVKKTATCQIKHGSKILVILIMFLRSLSFIQKCFKLNIFFLKKKLNIFTLNRSKNVWKNIQDKWEKNGEHIYNILKSRQLLLLTNKTEWMIINLYTSIYQNKWLFIANKEWLVFFLTKLIVYIKINGYL